MNKKTKWGIIILVGAGIIGGGMGKEKRCGFGKF